MESARLRGEKLALFGGTFDPIHNAHLAVAREAVARFDLSRVLVVPAGHPPHKVGAHASYDHRYRMVEIACRDEGHLEASRLEEGTAYSYSIETIGKARTSLVPEDQLFFLIGADAFAEIRTWKRWRDVIRAVEFIVVSRPGHRYAVPEGVRVQRLDTVELAISSSEVRRRLAAGDGGVPVPAAVLAYIREHGLYRSD